MSPIPAIDSQKRRDTKMREPRFVEVHGATITRTYAGGDKRTRRVTLVNTPHSVGELFPPNHPLWGNWRITAMVYCGMVYNVHSG